MTAARTRWPLLVIGAAAGTSTWSGWVGLGQLTGFGVIHPLPGIADRVALNTAITLPIGVEAYAVYALAVATGTDPLTGRARRYAWASAAGALTLGMLGQIAYHVMNAAGVTAAPWQVVALVSCLPVLVLGAASLLWHLAGETVPIVGVPAAAAADVEASDEPATEVWIAAAEPSPETRDYESPSPKPAARATHRLRPATDVELAATIADVLAADAKAGRGKVTAALKEKGLTPGNAGVFADAIAAHKRQSLHIATG